MRTRKLKKRLRERFGTIPDPFYYSGDMEHIRAYFDYRQARGMDPFLVDDITWNDLDMDQVFRRINPKRCTSGEQVLYYTLRSPVQDAEAYARRRELIRYAQADPERRLRAEVILARLGCTRRADLSRAFAPSSHGVGLLVLYLALLLFLLAAIAGTLLGVVFDVRAVLLSLFLNTFVHELVRRRSQLDVDTVNYTVNMIFAMQRLRRLRDPELDRHMTEAYACLDRLRSVLRTGGVALVTDSGGAGDALATVTLLDLICYEFLKNKLGRCYSEVFAIHEALGRLDTAISIASYRASLPDYAEPALDFGGDAAFVRALAMVHPLLEDPVPNDLDTDRPLLITGSNASGKSTYLKTAALAALLAQSICTVTAASYQASALRIYSSMALSDNILAGESYYIVETKSLKRILDAAEQPGPILCVVDEVLRGTNTIERVAASCEVLRSLAEAGTLCLAATHDIELCDLLDGAYRLFHFEEQVGGEEMLFDYVLRPGKATSRNAINLLRLLGVDEGIVERAHARANRYLETGSW